MVTRLHTGQSVVQFKQQKKNFLFSTMLRWALGPTFSYSIEQGFFFCLRKTDGAWRWPLTPTLCAVVPLPSNMPWWCGQGQLYLLLGTVKRSGSHLKYIMSLSPTQEKAPNKYWHRGWVGPKVGLEATKKRTVSSPCQKSNPDPSGTQFRA